MEQIAQDARSAAQQLAAVSVEGRNATLRYIKESILTKKGEILEANALDCQAAESSSALYKRLKLTEEKFDSLLEGCDQVADLPDPLGVTTLNRELTEGLVLRRVTSPIGVLAIIYEARPEAGVQIVTLALKSGNSLILKGGKEALRSNHAIFDAIAAALARANKEFGVPLKCIQLVDTREEISALLALDQYVDLVIPRGSNALVRHVKEQTKIPVLGHADGLCAIYVDQEFGDCSKAVNIITDAKTNYPAGCNAVETLLVHKKAIEIVLPALAKATESCQVSFRADEVCSKELPSERTTIATDEDWDTEFLDYILAVKSVDSLEEAIAHINKHGSHHTDCIITSNKENAQTFQQQVDSSGCYVNCSTRFADGFRYGFGAEVGISTSRIHSRGPVGVEGLILYKYM
eukprot:Gregarina_sp_Poly_1__5732@NODE_3013_length_1450_cov_308_379610_g1908_i0_p1_GENE_NODE_3013_length_1450_cov_308_379610_g1908_i0NODE_3013_length_1450_cov_308_379610_g1908_i0_p1_ORF_typecomplete_len406_score63_95Aldedh/PF00171_22/6_3e66LuxC/PF05893_14/6_1e02LuxC/PF05893_14/5_3e08_NODE_3013_length_1450_cov_308_379610_g1908_i01281345